MSRTYTVKAINVGSFDLGEADRVLTIFSAEKGLIKAVAKGARKPGSKMSGRSDVLCINELFLATGRTFEIISQAQTIENFPALRQNLTSLSYGLYFAELTACFGMGLEDVSEQYFQFLFDSLLLLSNGDALLCCMQFEMGLLDFLGYKPELTFCIACREALDEYRLSKFNVELGGVLCTACVQKGRRMQVREAGAASSYSESTELSSGIHITPLVWKTLVLLDSMPKPDAVAKLNSSADPPRKAADAPGSAGCQPAIQIRQENSAGAASSSLPNHIHSDQVRHACQRILQAYFEQRAGKRFKTLDLLNKLESSLKGS